MPRITSTSASLLFFALTAASAGAQAPETSAETPAFHLPADTQTALAVDTVKDAEAVSQVRIVRLSEIRGEAQLDRNTGRGFEPAFANIPITAGSRLRTQNGLAEVEFEDNSTVRLTPGSEVDFITLGRTVTGATITRTHVITGTVYVTLARTKDATFTLASGQSTLHPSPGSHLRLTLDEPEINNSKRESQPSPRATLAVMDGTVDLTGPGGSTVVPKKSTVALNGAEQPGVITANKIAPESFDGWDKQGNAYQSRYANSSFSGGTGALYGSSDLNYYGGFADLPGCGSVWRPYFANAAWDPYGAGTWALYPGAGYSFISPYPWGWLPFHSGSWQQCGAAGWGWSPNSQWSGLRNVASVTTGTGTVRQPHIPIKPPVGKQSFVNVGTHPVEASHLTAADTFTFRQNSAGLGVPREVFGKLGGTSRAVERHGIASAAAGVGYLTAGSTAHDAGAGRPSLASPRPVAVITRPSSSNNSFSAPSTAGPGFTPAASGTRSNASPNATSSPASTHMSSGATSAAAGGSGHK